MTCIYCDETLDPTATVRVCARCGTMISHGSPELIFHASKKKLADIRETARLAIDYRLRKNRDRADVAGAVAFALAIFSMTTALGWVASTVASAIVALLVRKVMLTLANRRTSRESLKTLEELAQASERVHLAHESFLKHDRRV